MIRRELLFAVPVSPGFRDAPEARSAVACFRTVIAGVVAAGSLALLFCPVELLNATALVTPLLPLLAGGISFYRQNRRLAPAAVKFTRMREVEVTAAPDQLPRFAWLAAGPVHFDSDGRPNRWAERIERGYTARCFSALSCASGS